MKDINQNTVTFRFYEELNDLLPWKFRKKDFAFPINSRRSVKDAIESLNIPHTEVDLILINGVSVDFSTLLKPGDRISVYPEFESLNIADLQHLRPKPLRNPKFICDVHLGRLARKLRLLGFDTLYRNDYPDEVIIAIQENEKRAILTCDRNLLKATRVQRGYLIRSRDVEQQIREVIRRFDLIENFNPLSRCPVCNGILEEVEKGDILSQLPDHTAATGVHFHRCDSCGKTYWQGTHVEKILPWIQNLAKG